MDIPFQEIRGWKRSQRIMDAELVKLRKQRDHLHRKIEAAQLLIAFKEEEAHDPQTSHQNIT